MNYYPYISVETIDLAFFICKNYQKLLKSCLPTHHDHPSPASQDQGVAFYVLKAIVTLAYPYPPPQMLTLCGSLLDIVIAIMKLFHSEARIQERMLAVRCAWRHWFEGHEVFWCRTSAFLKGFPLFFSFFLSLSLSLSPYVHISSYIIWATAKTPSQICGCPFREPRVFEIAHIYIYTRTSDDIYVYI